MEALDTSQADVGPVKIHIPLDLVVSGSALVTVRYSCFLAGISEHPLNPMYYFFFCQCVIMEAGDEVGEVFLS